MVDLGAVPAVDSRSAQGAAPSLGETLPLRVALAPARPTGRRSRLSRDLHDGVGQSLTALLVEIRVALDRGHAGRDDLLIIEREAQNALKSVRALAYQVRRRASHADPMAEAQRYAQRLLEASGTVLRWVDERASDRLSQQVAIELASAIRESITNAINHGLARVIEVVVLDAGALIRVTVRDDGIGFEPEAMQPTREGRGLGLLGNAERMASIGGIFTLRSRPGEGTVIVLEAPRFLRRKVESSPALAMTRKLDGMEVLTAAAG